MQEEFVTFVRVSNLWLAVQAIENQCKLFF